MSLDRREPAVRNGIIKSPESSLSHLKGTPTQNGINAVVKQGCSLKGSYQAKNGDEDLVVFGKETSSSH